MHEIDSLKTVKTTNDTPSEARVPFSLSTSPLYVPSVPGVSLMWPWPEGDHFQRWHLYRDFSSKTQHSIYKFHLLLMLLHQLSPLFLVAPPLLAPFILKIKPFTWLYSSSGYCLPLLFPSQSTSLKKWFMLRISSSQATVRLLSLLLHEPRGHFSTHRCFLLADLWCCQYLLPDRPSP